MQFLNKIKENRIYIDKKNNKKSKYHFFVAYLFVTTCKLLSNALKAL